MQEKEDECIKLREELDMVKEQSQMLQEKNQGLEARYGEDQQKWGKLSERVTLQMDEHKYAFQSKLPVDPFRRDNVF